MTFSQYFDYHSSLKPKWKDYYVSYKELRKQVQSLKQLLVNASRTHSHHHVDNHHHHQHNNNSNNMLYGNENEVMNHSSLNDDAVVQRIIVDLLSMIKSLHLSQQQQQQEQSSTTTTIVTAPTTSSITAVATIGDDSDYWEIHQCAQTFFDMLYSDVQTVHDFYNESILENEQVLKQLEHRAREENWQMKRELKSRARKALENDMVALYRRLEFLYSFLHVNRLAISHIVRKFSECIPVLDTASVMETYLPVGSSLYNVLHDEFCSAPLFCDSSLVKELMESTENLYALVFSANDHQAAMSQLREPHDKHSHSDTFKFAFTVGVIVPIVVMIIVMWLKSPATTSIQGFFAVFPVFRGTLLYILYTWLWGVNLYIFRRRRINHVFIFEFDPTTSLNHIRMFKTASVLTVIWVFYFFLYLGAAKGSINLIPIDAKYYPLALALTLILIVLFPFHAFHLNSRLTLLKVMGNLLLTPFGRADFRECFVADILTSMVIPITDTMYMFCFFFSNTWFNNPYDNNNKCHKINRYAGPCLTFLPYAWRLGQCLKKYYETRVTSHLMNALKYASAITVIILNTLHVNLEEERAWGPIRWVWLVAVIFSTLFSYSWDIQMDWGLLNYGRPSKSKSQATESVKTTGSSLEATETSRLLSTNNSSDNSPNSAVEITQPITYPNIANKKTSTERKKKQKISWKNTFKPRLRDRRFFANYVYLIVSVVNFVARFAWAGTISTFFEERKDFLKIIFGSIELMRRCSWSVFRLEWAVISNSEGYRKHATVPLPMGK